ncbi:MAG: hypothetical protein M1433_02065 [Candidatus Parvarchaeota archaeon]|nr:hypothetical protein [Candidatus Parvarchaeota archaeon]
MSLNQSKKGVSALIVIVGFVALIIVIIELIPYFAIIDGYFSTAPKLNYTQGVAVSFINVPASESPSSIFALSMQVTSNNRGAPASNVNLCLDNIGLFTLKSTSPCINIPTMFAGDSIPETFYLESPSNSEYANIPYEQQIGYYLNYSYSASSSQSLQFVSQQEYNSGSYSSLPLSLASFGTGGPISIFMSAQQPIIYGSTGQVQLILSNVGDGIVLGPVSVAISMNSNSIEVSPGLFGFTSNKYSNGTVVYSGNLPVGSTTENITIPVILNPTLESSLLSENTPYISPANIYVSISYSYEIDGFVPIRFNVQNYFIG